MITSKDELCEVAVGLFKRDGFERTSILRICEELNVTRGSFYHHFEGKNELLLYWFSQHTSQRVSFDLSMASPKEALKKFIMQYVYLISSIGQELMRAIFFAELEVKGKQYDVFNSDRIQYAGLVMQAKSQGEIKSIVPTEQLIDMFGAAFLGTVIMGRFQSEEKDIKASIEQIFETIYQ